MARRVITHVVTFRFRDEVTEAARESILSEMSTFPGHFPAMRRWRLGRNISQRDSTYTHLFVVEFAAEAELLAYLNSERHETFVRERWRPVIASRAVSSFEHPVV